jgi:uncharacterized protein (TIGR02594 family)
VRTTIQIQQRLKALGFDPGPADGILGPRTEAAISAFKATIRFNPRPFYGPLTDAALFGPEGDTLLDGVPLWMKVARSLDGQREIKGPRHNPVIVRMWEALKLPFRDDETPWCAAYVGYCLEEAGVRSTRSAAARSYEKWGIRVAESAAPVGCVATFWRGSPTGWQGHVGFLEGFDQRGRVLVRGGNQGDSVNVAPFDRARLTGLWWPSGHPVPSRRAPVFGNSAASSTNEA